MPHHDPFEALRRAALAGLAPYAPTPMRRAPRPKWSLVPEIPAHIARPQREALPWCLLHDAARHWRRAAPPWAPPLRALIERGASTVDVEPRALRVTARHATYRCPGIPPAWVPVIVAALTGRELPAVRRALAASVTNFPPEEPWTRP